jgi:hypothetical protein
VGILERHQRRRLARCFAKRTVFRRPLHQRRRDRRRFCWSAKASTSISRPCASRRAFHSMLSFAPQRIALRHEANRRVGPPARTAQICRYEVAVRAPNARTERHPEEPLWAHRSAHLERIKAPSRSRRRKATRTSCSASVSFAAVVSSCRDAVGTCCDNRTRRCSAARSSPVVRGPSSCSTPSDSVVAH